MVQKLPSFADAQRILKEKIAEFESEIEPSMDAHDGPRIEARELAWWLRDESDRESATTDRNIAYLRAYLEIADGRPLWAIGIPLAKRRIYLDRSVMRRLYRDGFVNFVGAKEPFFEVTASGHELISKKID